mmetsp:Transcript_152704/g.269546  ORF Transcript_152704/g.269546 Transcript_152704/m.269546 type:complete len:103 (+) Transcript_152704:124-432(+)
MSDSNYIDLTVSEHRDQASWLQGASLCGLVAMIVCLFLAGSAAYQHRQSVMWIGVAGAVLSFLAFLIMVNKKDTTHREMKVRGPPKAVSSAFGQAKQHLGLK